MQQADNGRAKRGNAGEGTVAEIVIMGAGLGGAVMPTK